MQDSLFEDENLLFTTTILSEAYFESISEFRSLLLVGDNTTTKIKKKQTKTHRIASTSSSFSARRRSASWRYWPYSEAKRCARCSSALRPYKKQKFELKKNDFYIPLLFDLRLQLPCKQL